MRQRPGRSCAARRCAAVRGGRHWGRGESPGHCARIALRFCSSASTSAESLGEVGTKAFQRDSLLAHGVAFADRCGAVVEAVEVHGHAVRRADLVLAAVAAADRAGVVELDVPELTEL